MAGTKRGKENRGSFVKGDPRINRAGRPKSFDALRTLAVAIANEPATDDEGEAVIVNGVNITRAERILRQWFAAEDTKIQIHAMEVAFGKVPVKNEITGEGGKDLTTVIRFEWVDEGNNDFVS